MALRGLLTTQEVADRLGVDRSRVYQWINTGRLEVVRVGGKMLLVTAASLRRLKRLPVGRPRKKRTGRGKK